MLNYEGNIAQKGVKGCHCFTISGELISFLDLFPICSTFNVCENLSFYV